MPASDQPPASSATRRTWRSYLLVVAVVTASLTVISGLADAALLSLRHIPDGRGTATISWTGKTGLHPTLSEVGGTVERFPVKGSGTLPNYFKHQGLTTSPTGIQAILATIHGTLAGTPFTITISLSTGGSAQQSHSFATVTGSLHGVPVSATLNAPITVEQLQRDLGTFNGTIGSQRVEGTISKPTSSHGHNTAHAVFDVTG